LASIVRAQEIDRDAMVFERLPPIQPFAICSLHNGRLLRVGVRNGHEFSIWGVEMWFEFLVWKLSKSVGFYFRNRNLLNMLVVPLVLKQPFQERIANPLRLVRVSFVLIFAENMETIINDSYATLLLLEQTFNASLSALSGNAVVAAVGD
jgi:hypothetical protein